MIKIKLVQYERRFEVLYRKELDENASLFEKLSHSLEISNHDYSLNEEKFYYSKSVFSFEKNSNSLQVSVEENEYKQLYLSYDTLDNLFNKLPKKSLLNLSENTKYEFSIDTSTEGNIQIIPYLIHYKDSMKRKLTQIKRRNQLIDLENDEKCRLTFKIIGHGNFEIKRISIIPKG